MGMCALWCRRQYKRYFIEERRQRENFDEIVAGQVHHGMYKNEEGDWEIVDPGEPNGSKPGYSQDYSTYGDQQNYKGGKDYRYSGGPGKGQKWRSPDMSEDDGARR